ncbi:DUF1127 domain-containing protein [Rhizobiales bacterium]|nr:DUF1127 domain-containing protein [Hongsoonwoonella zoysiae]NRG18852.1 DUF1127 domain-containing protein [Hongsoonwoonella zoysiae]
MLETVIRSYQTWKKYRQTRDELSRLSLRELEDLGLGCRAAGCPSRYVVR